MAVLEEARAGSTPYFPKRSRSLPTGNREARLVLYGCLVGNERGGSRRNRAVTPRKQHGRSAVGLGGESSNWSGRRSTLGPAASVKGVRIPDPLPRGRRRRKPLRCPGLAEIFDLPARGG